MAQVTQLPRAASLSAPLRQLIDAVEALRSQSAVELPGPQALQECSVLLSELDRLKAVALARVADVDKRGLHDLDDAASAASWVAQQESGLDRREVGLARRLSRFPALAERIGDGLALEDACRISTALTRLRPHVDRPDGTIDGQPGERVLDAVIVDGALSVICQAHGGLPDEHPVVRRVRAELQALAALPMSQLQRLERTFLLIAVHVGPGQLAGALSLLVDALLPLQLEDQSDRAHRNRGFSLLRKHDGGGWTASGDLDDECGELLHVVLTAQRATDPDAPVDTEAWAAQRAAGFDSDDVLDLAGTAGAPRSRRQQDHDALKLALRRLLDSGALGLRGKAAPHIAVTASLETLHGLPGALPPVSDSGRTVPLSLVRSWMCDSYITRFVLGIGRRVVEVSHTERTCKAHERRIKHLETGGQCEGAGCTRGPGTSLVPHHVTAWSHCGTTSLRDTALLCEQHHHDLHSGGATIRLKSGRRLNPAGWVE